ncbi:hypothetical protein GE09DRAFT_1150243 [Coniochaeta sp. 2T2.1]|nr:hypothetical protein GE09DRAFT_1150243 [Coniochaeta sp. 2T2.1]
MPDDEIRLSAELVGFSCLLSALGAAAALAKGTVWNILGLGVVAPSCIVSLLWMVLVLSKRRRLGTTSHTLGIKDVHDAPPSKLQGGRNVDLERSIRWVSADGW